MLDLIKLELKRFNLNSKIFIALICNLCILGIINLIFFVENNNIEKAIKSYDILVNIPISLVCTTCIIYASVLIGEIIISEYKNKTIMLLFTYPISRKKILLSKLILIFIFTFFNIILSAVFVFGAFYFIQVITKTIVVKLTSVIAVKIMVIVIISALKNSIIALIPVLVGLKTKSDIVTTISGVLLAGILYSIINGFSLSSIKIIPLVLIVISILIVYFIYDNIEKKDVSA